VPEKYRHLPLVGKCCSINEVLVKEGNKMNGNTICVSSNDSSKEYFSPSFSDFNRTGALIPGDEHKTFVAIVGNPCNLKYVYGKCRERSIKI